MNRLSSRGLVAFALIALPVPLLAQTLVLPRGADWKYEDSGVALPSDWKDPGFDDSAWSSGPAPLGYGETYIETLTSYGPDPNHKHPTTYFRSTFDLQDAPGAIRSMILRSNYDDGFVAYLNGQEVTRLSMPSGPIAYATFATSHEGGGYETGDIGDAIGALAAVDNVLAVEVHQTSFTSSDLVLDLEVETSTASATVTRGPYLQIPTEEGVRVRWRTSEATDTRLWYGDSPTTLTETIDDPAVDFEHEVLVTGLAPDTRVYYAIGTSTEPLAGGDADHHFDTSPPAGVPEPVRVWVIGDSGQPGPNQQAVRDAYAGYPGFEGTRLWMMLGDNAYSGGTEPEYQAAVFDAYPLLLRTVPLWPTRGNHDVVRAGPDNDYYDFFSLPTAGEAGGVASGTEAYYSFDFANVHFVCLDSEGTDRSTGGPMLTWLGQDLAANTADWTIAYWHHPPYTKGSHDSDDPGDSGGRMRDMRENVLPIADSFGVDVVLCGHSHSYERSFLLHGHYGVSSTLVPAMILDDGDGRIAGDGAYLKTAPGPVGDEGIVYFTAGNGSKLSGGPLDHPAMYTSMNVLGSVILDVTGTRMDVTFLDDTGAVRDELTIVKGAATAAPLAASATTLAIHVAPSPFVRSTEIRFQLPETAAARVRVLDPAGRVVRELARRELDAGEHRLSWDGRDRSGRAVAAGVYFVTLEQGGARRAAKVVLAR